MNEASVRDLRNRGGEILDKVLKGETIVITRDGVPTAQISPLPRPSPSPAGLILAWRNLPTVDAAQLRADIDDVIDQSL